jgi:hypothetical protein
LGDEVGLVERSFILGRTSATGKKSEYKELTLDKLSRLQKRKFSNAEQLALREAKLHTARRIQALADDAAAGASARVNRATQELLADATVKQTLEDEIAIALAEKKSRKELASTVGNALGRDLTSGLKKLMVSEMHRAKTRGVAMAIANKVDIYASSEGVESTVSVVPNRDACEDCRNLYTTDTGNPRTFKLSDLVGQGSNSDEGVSHSRKGGLHLGWKPVLPPAHPNCYCELTYVPPGMAWENGRLRVVDELRYKNQISKAVDKGTMSATITPKGPPSAQSNEPPKVGSLKGVSDPGREGRPPSALTTAEAATSSPAWESGPAAKTAQPTKPGSESAEDRYEDCPYGGGTSCSDHRGNGKKRHERDGTIMKEHAKYEDFPGSVEEQEQKDPAQDAEAHVASMLIAQDYDAMSKPVEVMKDNIVNGKITNSKPMKGHGGSINDSFKRTIEFNGAYLAKPGGTLYGSAVHREAAAYNQFIFFGSDRCPPTFVRTKGPIAESGQVWLEGYDNAYSRMDKIIKEGGSGLYDQPGKLIYAILQAAPDQDKAVDQLSQIAVQDILMSNGDRHVENFMINEDLSDIRAIDHGYCYEVGLNWYQGSIHAGFHANHRPLEIPAAMRKRFDTTTYGDMKRGFGENLQEWQMAQTFLRMKYVMHVADENDGKLPYKEFDGRKSLDRKTSLARQGAHQKFEDFMIDWIDEHRGNEESPEHATAMHFAEIGVFMPPVHQAEPEAHASQLAEGKNYLFEMRLRRDKAISDAYRSGMSVPGQMSAAEVEDINKVELAAAYEAADDATKKFNEVQKVFIDLERDHQRGADMTELNVARHASIDAGRERRTAENAVIDLEKETEKLQDAARAKLGAVLRDLDGPVDEGKAELAAAAKAVEEAHKEWQEAEDLDRIWDERRQGVEWTQEQMDAIRATADAAYTKHEAAKSALFVLDEANKERLAEGSASLLDGDRIDELDRKISAAQMGPRGKGKEAKAFRMPSGTSTTSAADIEREKRNG